MIGKSNKRPPPAVKCQGSRTTKIKRARENVQRRDNRNVTVDHGHVGHAPKGE